VTESIELKRDMAVTHDEFYRLIIKTIIDGHLLKIDPENSSVSFPFLNGYVDINLDNQLTRKIASLSIHHTPMNFKFQGLTKEQIDTYLEKFNTTFQKGGG
jgi:hypothetical protein